MEPEPKKCQYCQTIIKGRSDKLFCDAFCKSAFHNNLPNSNEAYMRSINKQLRTNRSALRKACPLGNATVRKDFLKTLGMDFKHITHTWKGKSEQLYFFCYDYGYTAAHDAAKVVIVQQQPYMDIPDIIQNPDN